MSHRKTPRGRRYILRDGHDRRLPEIHTTLKFADLGEHAFFYSAIEMLNMACAFPCQSIWRDMRLKSP